MSTFKVKYHGDPEFKRRHLEYISQKIQCPECKQMVVRSHITRHRLTKYHRFAIEKEAELRRELDAERVKQLDMEQLREMMVEYIRKGKVQNA
jgi:hypothetical protein